MCFAGMPTALTTVSCAGVAVRDPTSLPTTSTSSLEDQALRSSPDESVRQVVVDLPVHHSADA